MVEPVREMMIGESRLRLGPGRFVRDEAVGTMELESAHRRLAETFRWADEIGEPVRLFIDLARAGKLPRASRKVLWEGLKDERIERVAFYAPNPVARMFARFTISTMKLQDLGVFSSAEDALAWLEAGGDDHE